MLKGHGGTTQLSQASCQLAGPHKGSNYHYLWSDRGAWEIGQRD